MKMKNKMISVMIIISILPLSVNSFNSNNLLQSMAGYNSTLISEQITINGDVDLANQAIDKGWAGDGSVEDPYIIEDYSYNLATTPGFLLDISNTAEHIIVRNCYAHAPMPWDQESGGFRFNNVKNVEIIDCLVIGTPYYLMFSGWGPTYSAMILKDCENILIDNFHSEYYHDGNLHPIFSGIIIEDSSNIDIMNSDIDAAYPIHCTRTNNLQIQNVLMQSSAGTPYTLANHQVSISLLDCSNSFIENNNMMNYGTYGVYHDEETKNITVVENVFYSNYASQMIYDENFIENKYLDFDFPDKNQTFQGPFAPSPGHYPGSSYYTSGESFENRPDGTFDDSLWIDSSTGADWSSTIQASKTDFYGNEHKKILECYTGTGTTPQYSLKQDTTEVHDSGTVEFWFLKDASGTSTTIFSLRGQFDNYNLLILIEDDLLKYTHGESIIATSLPIENNKWYRVSIDYSLDGLYADLGSSQYRFTVYDSDAEKILFISPISDFYSFSAIRSFSLSTQGISDEVSIYLDAIGHYWPDTLDSPGYNIGDNQAEGILLDYKLQRLGIGYQKLGFYVDQESYKYITWDLNSPFDPKYNKLLIPIPKSDGLHNMTTFWATTDGIPQSSSMKQFNIYYETHFGVSEYLENGIAYPPGIMVLNDYDDLTVSLTYTTKDWYMQDTWTDASYYYKINDGSWMGPYVFNSGIGWQTAEFTIGSGNYSIFDNLYYYIVLDQYDDSDRTNHLESYYLTQEPVGLYFESEARESAFRKKISPIPYELTLDYSVFYQSQINAITSYVDEQDNVVNVTTFPFVDILYQNVSLDFYNTSNILDEYSISCYNETLLNHLMEGFTSNINTSTSPLFSYIDEISSPFLLPVDMNFTTDTPNGTHIKYLTIPAISFSYLVGHNLSFTGDLFNVTYQGTEMWPDVYHKVLTFVDDANNFIIRYDSATRIMVFFEYTNDTIINRMQKTTFVLIGNNASYPINIKIDWYDEIISAGVEIIPSHLLAIVYDPPGDHSFSQISSGTTITRGFSISTANTQTYVDEWKTLYFGQDSDTGLSGLISDIAGVLTKIPVLGDILTTALPGLGSPPGQHEFSQSVTEGMTTDYEFSITFGSTFTSSLNNEDPELIGPGGGDLYYGTGMIIYWIIKHRVRYIDTTTASNSITDKLRLWNGTNRMEYGLVFNTSFAVLGAHLDDYGLGNLTKFNPFLADEFDAENYDYLSKYQTDTLFFTPDYITELEYSTTQSYTETYSFTVDVSKSDFYCWNQIVTGSASVGLGFVAEVSLGAGLNIFESSGRRGWTYEFSMSTLSTTSTEENRQTLAHFEDDDGTPIGQHDQFGVQIYRDLRFNTFGYHVIPEFTYTSNPYEPAYSQDRRPPTISEIIKLDEFIGGNILLEAIAIDAESGINSVKIYYDNDPVFNPPDTEFLATLSQLETEEDMYNYLWDTAGLHGTYYLFIVSEDNSSNTRISNPYTITIDNVLPEYCQVSAYGIYEGPISLYTSAFDEDSGIVYVEYWDGDPDNLSSKLLGKSNDASTSYRYIWATDPNGDDDGLHYIFARAYDKAGNYLDSVSIEMEVDTYKEPKKGSFIGFGMIFVALSVLTIFVRKKEKNKLC